MLKIVDRDHHCRECAVGSNDRRYGVSWSNIISKSRPFFCKGWIRFGHVGTVVISFFPSVSLGYTNELYELNMMRNSQLVYPTSTQRQFGNPAKQEVYNAQAISSSSIKRPASSFLKRVMLTRQFTIAVQRYWSANLTLLNGQYMYLTEVSLWEMSHQSTIRGSLLDKSTGFRMIQISPTPSKHPTYVLRVVINMPSQTTIAATSQRHLLRARHYQVQTN